MASAPSGLHFEIDSWVVFQLGEQLVTDIVQALVELVKNCYDADATFAKVTINTTEAPGEPFEYKSAPGYVLIEDNGTGMTDERKRVGAGMAPVRLARTRTTRGRSAVRCPVATPDRRRTCERSS